MPVKPGLRELLAWLKQVHILCAVATSTFTNVAIGYLKNAGVLNCFAAIVGGDQVTKSKPDPEIFQLAMRALGSKSLKHALYLKTRETAFSLAQAAASR